MVISLDRRSYRLQLGEWRKEGTRRRQEGKTEGNGTGEREENRKK